MNRRLLGVVVVGCGMASAMADEPKQLLWGDTHLHTSYSFDAFLNGNHSADPDTAYRYAKGMPVIHPYNRTRVQIRTPLDFLVVSDHAEFIGSIREIYANGIKDPDAGPIDSIMNWYRSYRIRDAIDSGTGAELFANALPMSGDPVTAAARFREDVAAALPGADVAARNAWRDITETADRHNAPGRFTALIGWEWSSIPGGANLHRVVLTDADGEQARTFLPFSAGESPYPEDLWAWLEKTSEAAGVRFVAIPHNSNVSKGLMFDEHTLEGEPMDAAYAALRGRWEPIVEVTQIKGDSETHPQFSPNDEFADFERYSYYIQRTPSPYEPHPGDFVRAGLRTGLVLEARLGVNPFRFGLIGSTDAHTGLSSAEEPNFWGKMATDSIPENKAPPRIAHGATGWSMSAAGLAAVWASDNTRESIVDAFQRRETYATTGTRIRVEVRGGWDAELLDGGVPMGGELPARPDAIAVPNFAVRAMKDPVGANLDRVQIVKGWLDANGDTHERVFDAVWSDERELDGGGKLPAVGDTVDRETGTYTNSIGAAQLETVWRDAEFSPNESAFYYVRVLEIPTPRHALFDALALGLEEPSEGPSVIQERAYTSPIWYVPTR